MSTVSRSTKISGGTTLQSSTVARAVDVETDMLTIFNAHNNHDAGTSKWTVLSALNATACPLIADNGAGSNDIANFRANGSTVVAIKSAGQIQAANGTVGAPEYGFSTDSDNGMYLVGANNPALSAGGTKVVDLKSSGVAILGTTTNDSASTGFNGEYVESVVSGVTFSGGLLADITSISLTAGDWDITWSLMSTFSGVTLTGSAVSAVSNHIGNDATGLVQGSNRIDCPGIGSFRIFTPLINYRQSLSTTTTIYGKVLVDFSGGTPSVLGRLSARRIR